MINVTYPSQLLRDKILACWIGKNIGGTIGTPYEGQTQMHDIHGYSSPKGEPLPNDDLDLQIAWFITMEQYGPAVFDANLLSETWQKMIVPNWNEYGLGKKNLRAGLLPPLSGEFENDKWKHSNGAWIRSEIWACLAPGFPNVAIKYAIMDASIDHGLGEGTYAEIFTAAMESIAFMETDIRKIVETALGFIPADSRVAQCARLVLNEYDKKTPYREVRQMLVESTADLGWFQAPANVGYVVLGLIYGEGDFKNSIIYAVNCGDDTDCTGGTVGAVMGIIGGTAGIPADWQEYIGDRIMQICIQCQYNRRVPKTCTEFTDRILAQLPTVLLENGVNVSFGDALSYDQAAAFAVLNGYSAQFFNRSRFSFDVTDHYHIAATVEYEREPVVRPGEEFRIRVTYRHIGHSSQMLSATARLELPQGWSADYRKSIHVVRKDDLFEAEELNVNGIEQNVYYYTVTVGETVAARNSLLLVVEHSFSGLPFVAPITLLG